MSISKPTLAKIRFGYGLKTGEASRTADDLLGEVGSVPHSQDTGLTKDRLAQFAAYKKLQRQVQKKRAPEQDLKAMRKAVRSTLVEDTRGLLTRAVASQDAFVERLVSFWADHFTVGAKNRALGFIIVPYRTEAIRPNIGGYFEDLLIAVVTHPAMLLYLDQNNSTGPNSVVGLRKGLGLNENLAREVLELHSLGVGSAYNQTDVTELAELLTGLRFSKDGFKFNRRFAEPGPETVLGQSYGGQPLASLGDVRSVLRDIAIHPDTARHIARKLAVHFTSDTPDEGLVRHLEAAYLASGGHLGQIYGALLEHPASWSSDLAKVKQPFDFVVSGLRAFGFDEAMLRALSAKDLRRLIQQPLQAMGQPLMRPPGPDGWPEAAQAWITPATLAARIEWATTLSRKLGQDLDPREFLDGALKDGARANTRFLVSGAESKWEGVALVLAAPEFNRR